MSQSDTIADLLTRIRNASVAKHRYVDAPYSRIKQNLLEVLREKGFIESFLVDKERRLMRVFLRYTKARSSVITGLKRISKPGCRKYVGYQNVPSVCSNLGVAIISTPKGVLAGDAARSQKVGGELLCVVW